VFDIIGKRRWFYVFSTLITVPGVVFILLTPLTGGAAGLQFSIDYTGGTIWEVRFRDRTPTPAEVREVLAAQGLPGSSVALTEGGRYVLIRTEPIGLREPEPSPTPLRSPGASPGGSPQGSPGSSPARSPAASPAATPQSTPSPSPAPTGSPAASPSPGATGAPGSTGGGGFTVPTEGKLGEVARALQARFGPIVEVRQQTSVGPLISQELTQQALLLIALGSIGILTWISFRFSDFKMGVTAIAALIHDVVVVVGTFAILGTLLAVEIDALFVTAMLTVIGFSVHDTIVVFDRIRENRVRHAGEPFAAIVNHSILQTFGRSINTSLTVVITLTALLLFGGEAIRVFVLALLIGIISGTYSSIFNASALLVSWHERDERRRQQALALGHASR
jgi:preprotein translocase SecF subunit